jgi:hypothetical protein
VGRKQWQASYEIGDWLYKRVEQQSNPSIELVEGL